LFKWLRSFQDPGFRPGVGDRHDLEGFAARLCSIYFLYTVGWGPFSSVSRSQIMPSRV
jgi:hypothetical protein